MQRIPVEDILKIPYQRKGVGNVPILWFLTLDDACLYAEFLIQQGFTAKIFKEIDKDEKLISGKYVIITNHESSF